LMTCQHQHSNLDSVQYFSKGMWKRSSLRHYATSRKVAEITGTFDWPNPSSCTIAPGSTQPLVEMSTRNLPGGKGWPTHRADNLTAVSQLSRKCGSLDISKPYGSPEPVTGTALLLQYCRNYTLVTVVNKACHQYNLWSAQQSISMKHNGTCFSSDERQHSD
jgi:hypothetical protein